MWVVFILTVIFLWVVDTIVVVKLQSNYPEAYKAAGSPPPLWQGISHLSFSQGFIGMGEYKLHNLDSVTMAWCRFYQICNWLWWCFIVGYVAWLFFQL